jgi:putative membrane protein
MYFEKGPTYYLHSAPFIAKLTLFAIVGLISIYPTAEFLSWRNALVRDQVPTLPDTKRRRLRSVIQVELVGVVLLILCAALMAKGIGQIE